MKDEDQTEQHQSVANGTQDGQKAKGAKKVEKDHWDVDDHQPLENGGTEGGQLFGDLLVDFHSKMLF